MGSFNVRQEVKGISEIIFARLMRVRAWNFNVYLLISPIYLVTTIHLETSLRYFLTIIPSFKNPKLTEIEISLVLVIQVYHFSDKHNDAEESRTMYN